MGKSIRWKLAEQYPACQNLDIHDYIYLKNKSPSFIVFTFNVQKNLGVCLFIEERNKATSRSSEQKILQSKLNVQCTLLIPL